MLLLILPAGWGQAGIFQWVNGLKRRAGMRPWCSWMLEPLNDFSRRHFVIDQCIISKFLENMLKWDELVKIITQSLDLFQLGQLTHTWPMEEKWNNKSSGRMVFFQFCRFQPVIYLYAWNYFPSFPLLGITPRPVRICMPHHHVFFQIVLYHFPWAALHTSQPLMWPTIYNQWAAKNKRGLEWLTSVFFPLFSTEIVRRKGLQKEGVTISNSPFFLS